NNLYKNFLYRNNGNGVFARATNSGLTDHVEDTFAVCWADYDNDGFLDLFLANFHQNSLYHNNGDGTFTAVTDSAVVQDTIPSNAIFASGAGGASDNDGFFVLSVTVADCLFPPSAECLHTPRANNFLYHNSGDGTFTKVTQGSVVNDLITKCP